MASRKTSSPLHIVIVGSGIAGLATAFCLGRAGHQVTVLERSSHLSEIGAGIQISPNMARLLFRWGVGDLLMKMAVKPESLTFCRYSTGEVLGSVTLGDNMINDHGAPYLHVHRRDLLQLLFNLAKPYMKLELGSKVIAIDPHRPSVTLSSGHVIESDLLIGADGTYSIVRDVVYPHHMPRGTGDGAYRAVVPVEKMKCDPELSSLVDPPQCHCWIGPSCHIVSYCISGGKDYNIVMVVPEDDSFPSWTAQGDPERLRAHFANWEPRVGKLLGLITSVLQTRITISPPLPVWVHPSNCVALVGDACHPLLPYRAQAAAMTVEDAAVLGSLLSRLQNKGQLPWILEGYQALRIPRTTATMADSWLNRTTFHLPDGPEQISRDSQWRETMGHIQPNSTSHTNPWRDRLLNIEQFSYDAEYAADAWWTRMQALIDLGNVYIDQAAAKL